MQGEERGLLLDFFLFVSVFERIEVDKLDTVDIGGRRIIQCRFYLLWVSMVH